ncbi:MAG: addiction module antidote protein, HigA family [Betaproteobacteria bacterium]|nr:MAG: addiction module antidote protein, HigA family [Betaproteobacteria bacterium]
MPRKVPLATPGEILLHDFLEPMGISQYRLAKEIGVPQRRIGEIVAGRRGITADTALRLAAYFGTDAQSWINLQSHYDTEMARESMDAVLSRIRRWNEPASA